MSKNLFWPIYEQIEKEFKEISYFVSINRKQLKTYSVKIADLILRTVSECENIANELCKKENIKFKDKKGNIRDIVYFGEYIQKLDKIFDLKDKHVSFDYKNADAETFDMKRMPFRKEDKKIKGKKKSIWNWYQAYNMVKHDRINNFNEANLGNLIDGLAALFLLNIYYLDKTFYDKDNYNIEKIEKNIESFSDVFSVDFTIKLEDEGINEYYEDSFFNPYKFWEISKIHATYIIEYDKKIKTASDKGAEFLDKLESKVLIEKPNGTFKKKYEDYEFQDRKSICAITASINRKD